MRRKRLTKPFEVLGYFLLVIITVVVLYTLPVKPAKAQASGSEQPLPPPFEGLTITDNILTTTVTYTDTTTHALTTTTFLHPHILFDGTRDVTYISTSPIDPSRSLDDIPTAPLALFHYWLIKQQLFRAQLVYGDCVGQIKAHQKRLNLTPLIDEPGSLKDVVTSIRDYTIPFNPIQHPLERKAIIAHTKAAIATHNLTVFHIGLCRTTLTLLD